MDVLKTLVNLIFVCVVATDGQEIPSKSFVASKKIGPASVNFDDFLPIFNYQPPSRDAENGISIFAPTSFQFMTHHNSLPSGTALENYNTPTQSVYPDVGQLQPFNNQYSQVAEPYYKYSDSAKYISTPIQNSPGLDISNQFTPSFGPPVNLDSPQNVPQSYGTSLNVGTPRYIPESYNPPSNFDTSKYVSTPNFPSKTLSYISSSQKPSSELGLSQYANTSPDHSSEIYAPQHATVSYDAPSYSTGPKYASIHEPSSLLHAPPTSYNSASSEHAAEEDDVHQKDKESLEQSENQEKEEEEEEEEDTPSSEPQHIEEEQSDEDSESTSPAHLEEPYHNSEEIKEQIKVPHFYPGLSSYHHGSGNQHKQNQYEGHGHSSLKKGTSSDHHDEKNRGEHEKNHEAGEHEEKAGNKNNYHDEAGHFKNHRDEGKRYRGAKFGEKKGHRKGHKTKGYHNKFFKDEYHKEHKFYDDYHKKGRFNKFGDYKANRYHNEGAIKKGGKELADHNAKFHGKKGAFAEGHYDKEDEGFDKKEGDNQYHKHYANYGKKGGKDSGKTYGFKTP